MSGAVAKRIESGAAAVAAAALGCAVAFAGIALLEPIAALSVRSTVAILVGTAVALGCWHVLSRVGGEGATYAVTAFDLPELASVAADEPLELTETDEAPLVLDDVLQAVGPDARVVRLFDASAMPTPAQLKARVDRYLGQGASWAKSPDASQALVDALTELRRSLR